MIEFVRFRNIQKADEDYIVIPVNAVGAPGAGLAKWWADNAPAEVVQYYKMACARGDVYPGQIMTFKDSSFVLAVTKDHWIHPSEYEWIDDICKNLNFDDTFTKKTVAVPKLGCGLGRLSWVHVKQIMIEHLEQARGHFIVYT